MILSHKPNPGLTACAMLDLCHQGVAAQCLLRQVDRLALINTGRMSARGGSRGGKGEEEVDPDLGPLSALLQVRHGRQMGWSMDSVLPVMSTCPIQSHCLLVLASHHMTPHHTTSTPHHIASHHITSHLITSHLITSHHITSHHITSHHIMQETDIVIVLAATSPCASSNLVSSYCTGCRYPQTRGQGGG